jgi:hypothetical protein
MEGEYMVRKKKETPVEAVQVQFGLRRNNIYLKNASYMLERAALFAEVNNDTDTLLQIAGAWLEIAKWEKDSNRPRKKKLQLGFTTLPHSDRMIEEEEEDDE